jgi:uncharacterized Zn finger protein
VMTPIAAYRGAIARTFWGKAWCDNLEHYSDYANRLPRGRTYVRNGSVIDLNISAGAVRAQVMGSSRYSVEVTVTEVAGKHWQAIGADCAGSIDSLVELLQGKLSKAVMERICQPATGLFPAPKEIRFKCSCPDSASMCKHIAAVLYGVGARLDQQPELLFSLRGVDARELVAQAGAGLPTAKPGPATRRVLDDADLGDVFGIEMGGLATPPTGKAVKAGAKSAQAATAKPPTTGKTVATKSALAKMLLQATSVAKPRKTVAKPAAAKPAVAKPEKPLASATLASPAKTAAPGKPPKTSAGPLKAVGKAAPDKAKAVAKEKLPEPQAPAKRRRVQSPK